MDSKVEVAAQDNAVNDTTGDNGIEGNAPMGEPIAQNLHNLPTELLAQPRFFRVGREVDGKFNVKAPIDKWNNPANQRLYNQLTYTDSRQMAGFDIVGHGVADDYLVLDFDHVLNDEGEFINDEVEDWYNYLCLEVSTYCEQSISGHGLHMLFRPTGDLPTMAAGSEYTLQFDGDAKIEIFYKPNGRYFLLTGNVFYCDSQAPIATDTSSVKAVLTEIAGRNAISNEGGATYIQTYSADLQVQAREALKVIPCNALTYHEWLNIGMALKTNGNTIEDWVEWSKLDGARFSEKVCYEKWKGFSEHGAITVATIFYSARRFGFTPYFNFNAPSATAQKELSEAIEYLRGFTEDNLTPDIVRDAKTIHALALCNEYDNCHVVDDFIELAASKKFPAINRKTLRRDVKDEQERVHINSLNYARDCARKAQKSRQKKLDYLKALPTDVERDSQMRKLIQLNCKYKFDKATNVSTILPIIDNARQIFENDPMLDGLIGYDEFSRYIVFLKSPTWKRGGENERWTDADDAQLRFFLRDTYSDFSGEQLISDCIMHYALENSFHKVKRYLESLQWDGVARAETLFIKFLGVDDTPYSREITFKWLLAAVARIYYPGCDFQFALVLQGRQGIGKSHITQMLGREWSITLADSLDDTHAIDAIQSAWIAEIAEWAAGRKSELNAQKSFISRGYDTRRAAYAKREETTPRHCVFVVTINDAQFLRDPTGNRRFKILECENQRGEFVDGLTDEYINQVWAEIMTRAKEIFANGFDAAKLRLSREVDLQAEDIADRFTVDDELANEIHGFLDILIPDETIWRLMTKPERRRFFEEGSISFYISQLRAKYEALPSRYKSEAEETMLNYAISEGEDYTPDTGNDDSSTPKPSFKRFYGKEQRQHICAAEIFNECFGQDKRKFIQRVNEVLDQMDGWQKGDKPLCYADPQYSNQRKPYYRTAENTDDTDPDFIGEELPDHKTPF